MLYLESVVGQFTNRDCIDVWKVRPCLAFVGYVLVAWQVCVLIYNHVVTSFFMHYFLISLENPIPYYTCGSWSTKYCNSLVTNYTVNQECVKYQNLFSYCENLYETFPEYQYWRKYLIERNNRADNIAWRVCLASCIICLVIFFSCFKRNRSLKWVVSIFVIYPVATLAVLLMGSMLQKGVVAKYEDSLDLDFKDFKKRFRLSSPIIHVVYNLNIGTGLMVTLASSASFRSPCFSDVVICVVTCSIFTILYILTIAMMSCPYAFEYGIRASALLKSQMSFSFEKIPRLLYQYQHRRFYLVIVFSCNTVLGISTSVIYLYNILEVIMSRYTRLAKYPGVVTFCVVTFLFLLTIPLLNNYGINVLAYGFRRFITAFSTFISIIECLVFVIWYGLHKFSEDIHFMLGIKQKSYIKMSWIISFIFLIYTLINEIYYQFLSHAGFIYANIALLSIIGLLLLLFILGLLIAAFKNVFRKYVSLDPTWGPKIEILQRSRGMFSAQAMTKEYIYRQYHLQAGIIKRQRKCNTKVDI